MESRPTIAIVLDKRTRLKSGQFPVRLRVTFPVFKAMKKTWVRRFYSPAKRMAMSEDTFAAVMGKSRMDEHKLIRSELHQLQLKAVQILESNKIISPDIFTRLFTGQAGAGNSVGSQFARIIAELMEFDQVATAASYRTAAESLRTFAKGDFSFQEISQDWLRRYEKWMKTREIVRVVHGKKKVIRKGASGTTVSIYLRCLRAVFNRAIASKIISADYYPFGRRLFSIQTIVKPKQALTIEQKDQVLAFHDDKLQRSVDFWIFSYFCNGMNFADICQLRRRDIRTVDGHETIYLDRAKTLKTSAVLKKIEIPLRKEARAIITRYGNKTLNPDDYVFPILREGLTPLQRRYKIQAFTGEVNADLRRVADKLGFTFKFTTYTARHTFANVSLQKGASKAFIQEAMGHQSIRTTEVYTAGFETETKRKMNERL